MIYNTSRRCFTFDNKAELPPSALLFYDLPFLLSSNEDPCEEVNTFANALPRVHEWKSTDTDWKRGALPHQPEAIKWILERQCTGIVAYGMGLGKTFIGIRAVTAFGRKRIVVVCPPHLKDNWAKEIAKFMQTPSVHICDGYAAAFSADAQFTVISANLLNENIEGLLAQGFDQVLVDESHKCGNWGTASYKALNKICMVVRKNSGGVLLMTGTLFKNSPLDAHSALHLLDTRIPGPREAFKARFDPIGKMYEDVRGRMRRNNSPQWLIDKKWEEIREKESANGRFGDVAGLRWLLSRYAIRKKYSEVFPDDGKTRAEHFESVDLNLTNSQLQTLTKRALIEDDKIQGDLATILRVVAEKKAPFVGDYVASWLEDYEDQKVVVATWHVKAREIIKKSLEQYGVVEIKGNRKQKSKAEALFTDNPDIRVCVLNLDSGGTGLNLVAASHLVYSEVPWTSAAMEQVGARIDRIGQLANDLLYTIFLAANTPEGAKWGTVKKKSGLNDRYLGA